MLMKVLHRRQLDPFQFLEDIKLEVSYDITHHPPTAEH